MQLWEHQVASCRIGHGAVSEVDTSLTFVPRQVMLVAFNFERRVLELHPQGTRR